MQDYADYRVAEQALWNPQTPVSALTLIAQYHPSLRAAISTHPNADDTLLEWLKRSGVPPVGFSERGGGSVPAGSSAFVPEPLPQPDLEPIAPRDAHSSGRASPVQPVPKRRRTGLVVGIIAVVVVSIAATMIGLNVFDGGTPKPSVTQPSESTDSGSVGEEIYTFGGREEDSFSGIVLDSGGVIYAGGMTQSTDGDFTGFSGDFAWAWVVIDTEGKSTITEVKQYIPVATLKDGGLVGSGWNSITAVNRSGAILWNHRDSSTSWIHGVAVAPDGSIAAVGMNENLDNIVTMLNADGTKRWSHNYGNVDIWSGPFFDVAFFGDGSLGVVSYNQTDKPAASFVVINPQGDISSIIDLDDFSMTPYAVSASPDGTVVAAGETYIPLDGSTEDAVVAKFSVEGDIQWIKKYGGLGGDGFNDVAVDSDGRIFAAGLTWSGHGDFYKSPVRGIEGGEDAVIVQLSSDGSLEWAQVWAGSGNDILTSIAVNESRVCAVGSTTSTDGAFTGTKSTPYTADALVICVSKP